VLGSRRSRPVSECASRTFEENFRRRLIIKLIYNSSQVARASNEFPRVSGTYSSLSRCANGKHVRKRSLTRSQLINFNFMASLSSIQSCQRTNRASTYNNDLLGFSHLARGVCQGRTETKYVKNGEILEGRHTNRLRTDSSPDRTGCCCCIKAIAAGRKRGPTLSTTEEREQTHSQDH